MSGSPGDDHGTVYLAHVWVPDEYRQVVPGPWHWWHVYKDHATAEAQAARRGDQWRPYAKREVHVIHGGGS